MRYENVPVRLVLLCPRIFPCWCVWNVWSAWTRKNIYAESASRLDPSAPQNSIRSAVRTLRTRISFLLRFEELMNAFASCPEFQGQFEWLTSELGEEGFREKHLRGGRSPQQTPVLLVKKCAVSRSIPIAENEFRLANP